MVKLGAIDNNNGNKHNNSIIPEKEDYLMSIVKQEINAWPISIAQNPLIFVRGREKHPTHNKSVKKYWDTN